MTDQEQQPDNVPPQQSGQVLRMAQRSRDEQALWQQLNEPGSDSGFFQAWLAYQCRTIVGVRGAVLVLRRRADRSAVAVSAWPDPQAAARQLVTVATDAIVRQQGGYQPVEVDEQDNAIAASGFIVAQGLSTPGAEMAVAIEVSSRGEAELERLIRALAWGLPWVERRLALDTAQTDTDDVLHDILDVAAVATEHEEFHKAATAFVSEIAIRFGCERASLGFVDHQQVRLRAASHSAQFAKKGNLTRSIEAAMDEALDHGGRVVFPAEDEHTGPLNQAHAQLAATTQTTEICSIPFLHGEQLRGVLTLERQGGARLSPEQLDVIEATMGFVGPLLDVQRREDRLLVGKAVDSGRKNLRKLFGPYHVALKLATSAVLSLLLVMAFVTDDFAVTAETTIEAQRLQAASAPFDGYVVEAPARAGDTVQKGDLLAALDTRELSLEERRIASELAQQQKEYRQALAERNAPAARVFGARMEGTQARLAMVRDQLANANITAPFNGIVVSGDLSQRIGVPIERGELLFEVAPLGEYRLALAVEERDIDEVKIGQTGSLILSATPDTPLRFTVSKITPVAEVRDGTNAFRVEAVLDEVLPRTRPDMTGVAKIEIEQRSVLWIWTSEITDWLRLTFWRWLP